MTFLDVPLQNDVRLEAFRAAITDVSLAAFVLCRSVVIERCPRCESLGAILADDFLLDIVFASSVLHQGFVGSEDVAAIGANRKCVGVFAVSMLEKR